MSGWTIRLKWLILSAGLKSREGRRERSLSVRGFGRSLGWRYRVDVENVQAQWSICRNFRRSLFLSPSLKLAGNGLCFGLRNLGFPTRRMDLPARSYSS
jgi:hypothetical protein